MGLPPLKLYRFCRKCQGKSSDRDTAGRRLSAEQQEFFKDSKVRDENGNLIALYHGTENGGFTVFDAAKSDDGISLFFTDDLKVAETYSGSDDDVALPAAKPPMLRWTEGNTKRGKQQAGVYEVYLNLKNPLVVECEGKTWGSIPFGDGTPVDLSYHIKHGEIVFSVKAKDRPTQTVRFADNANTEAEVRKFLTKTFNKEIGKRYSKLFASVREDDADYGWKDSFERAVAFSFNWDFSNNTPVPTSTRGIAAQAKKEGYDGVIFRNLHDYGGHKVKGVSYASKKTTNIYVAFNKNAVKDVDNKTPTANKDIRYSERDSSEIVADAVSHFGTTYSWKETGYLLTNGKRLDFSGRHEGGRGGYRTVDHRDIVAIYPEDSDLSGGEAMVDFMYQGNIRIMPEGNGINLSVLPTKEQERALDDYISRARGEVTIDIDDAQGNTLVSVEYPRGTYSKKILQDIRKYFEDGTQPVVSDLAQFRYSERDRSYLQAISSGDMQTAQKMVDVAAEAAGYTGAYYHGSPNKFTAFDIRKSKSAGTFGKGFYFSDSETHAKQYGNTYKVFLNMENPLRAGSHTVKDADLRKFIEAVSQNEDYSIEN